jgi:hypothetical protein
MNTLLPKTGTEIEDPCSPGPLRGSTPVDKMSRVARRTSVQCVDKLHSARLTACGRRGRDAQFNGASSLPGAVRFQGIEGFLSRSNHLSGDSFVPKMGAVRAEESCELVAI